MAAALHQASAAHSPTTAAGAASFGLPVSAAFAQATAPGKVMTALSDYMSSAATRALPDDVAEQAKYHLLADRSDSAIEVDPGVDDLGEARVRLSLNPVTTGQ